MSYPKIIAAICTELQRRHDIAGRQPAITEEVVGKMLSSQTAMPDYMHLAMRLLTWSFDYWALVTSGVRFRNMPAELQRQQIDAWKSSRFDVCRNFVRFYESLYFLIVMEEEAR